MFFIKSKKAEPEVKTVEVVRDKIVVIGQKVIDLYEVYREDYGIMFHPVSEEKNKKRAELGYYRTPEAAFAAAEEAGLGPVIRKLKAVETEDGRAYLIHATSIVTPKE